MPSETSATATGMAEAKRRIEEARIQRATALDLSGLDLTSLPAELFELADLEELRLRSEHDSSWNSTAETRNVIDTLPDGLAQLKRLSRLILPQGLRDLGPAEELTSLTSISLSYTNIDSLERLRNLRNLRHLDCSSTHVSSLAPIHNLCNLQHLDCSGTQIASLEPLHKLLHLRHLDCSGTQIASLRPVHDLVGLQYLNCSATPLESIEPVRNLRNLQWLYCSGTRIKSLESFCDLLCLRHLDCSYTPVDSLEPIRYLRNLRYLDCSYTPVNSLEPVRYFPHLQHLDCRHTDITSLESLRGLFHLQYLDCGISRISSLAPIRNLIELRTLDCSSSLVASLKPTSRLAKLESLFCARTPIDSFEPLRNLVSLRKLDLSATQIASLEPIRNLTQLQELDCSLTKVDSLHAVTSLSNLRFLILDGSAAKDLGPVVGLRKLEHIRANDCPLVRLPPEVVMGKSLRALQLHNVPGIAPPEVLSKSRYDNCLPALRAHLQDLAVGDKTVRTAKVITLGNGRVGKTQICRRLRGLGFDPDVPSTHGISVTTAPWSGARDGDLLNLWDFGGQDIYHGAHALFMNTRAVFVVVWHPDFERRPEEEHGGLLYRNHPLSYWLEYVRTLARPGSPMVVVQSRCERPESEMRRLPVEDRLLELPSLKPCWYSAKTDRGRAALDEAIRDGIHFLHEQDGPSAIGAGRWRVLRQLENWRDEDRLLAREARQHRTLAMDEFQALCADATGISSPERFLEYLHNLGAVFYRHELFHGRIILDQSWALDAVYAIFERQTSFRQITGTRGRFTRPLLELLVWRDYTPDEQLLFISLMESAGICFRLRPESESLQLEPEYIVPDLLPEKSAVQGALAGRWDDRKERRLEYQYEFLHTGLMRALLCDVGGLAGEAGVYWKYGAWAYSGRWGSRVMLEAEPTGKRGGKVIARLQGGSLAPLAKWLRELFVTRNRMFGYPDLAPTVDEFEEVVASVRPPQSNLPRSGPRVEEASLVPTFDKLPPARFARSGPEIYVSYAWGDSTSEGRKRETLVDGLCQALEERGTIIRRDRQVMTVGSRISEFMDRLAASDFIVLVISDKYLRSPYCMYELFRIFDNARREPDRFLDRVLPVVLPDAKLKDMSERLGYARYWRDERSRLTSEIGNDPSIVGGEVFKKYKAICDFAVSVSDVLEYLVDCLRPHDLDRLAAEGFSDIVAVIESRGR